MKYRKKPVVIEAMQFTADTKSDDVINVFGEDPVHPDMNGYFIQTLEGVMEVKVGDYIIKEPFPTGDRKFYPCKLDIFEQTYEPVSGDYKQNPQHMLG